jgi:hypothetical protein
MRSALPKPHSLAMASTGKTVCSSLQRAASARAFFGKLRRCLSDFAAKEPGKIAGAHGHAIRQGGYTEIVTRVTQDPGLQFLYLWPAPHFQVFYIGAELGLPPGAPGKNHHHPGDGERNFPAEIFFDQG